METIARLKLKPRKNLTALRWYHGSNDSKGTSRKGIKD